MTIRSVTGARFLIIVAALSVLFFFARLFPYVERPTAGFMAYYTSGKLLLNHYDMTMLYSQKQFHDIIPVISGSNVEDEYRANPPILSMVFLPFAFFTAAKAKLLWEIFSLCCLIFSLILFKKYFILNTNQFIAITGLTFALMPLYVNFVYGQLYAVLLLLQILLLIFWKSQKKILASLALVLMLSLKGYGVLFLLLAALLNEWLIIVWSGVGYGLIVAGSSFLLGMKTWLEYFNALKTLLTSSAPAVTFQQNIQSFTGFLVEKAGGNSHSTIIVSVIIIFLFCATVAILYILSKRMPAWRLEIPFSFAAIGGVLFAPQLFDYHYSLLLIPIVIILVELSHAQTKFELIGFGFALFLLSAKIPYYYPIFQNTWLWIAGFPRIYGAIILLWLLIRIAVRFEPAKTSTSEGVSNALPAPSNI
jgi:hypothetical protein